MEKFFEGFEKRAGFVRKGLRTVGNITGVRHLKTGLKQKKNLKDRGKVFKVPGEEGMPDLSITKRKFVGQAASADRNVATGVKRLAGTGLALGTTAGGIALAKKADAGKMGLVRQNTGIPNQGGKAVRMSKTETPKVTTAIRGNSSMKI